jgi:hypothetical protein
MTGLREEDSGLVGDFEDVTKRRRGRGRGWIKGGCRGDVPRPH